MRYSATDYRAFRTIGRDVFRGENVPFHYLFFDKTLWLRESLFLFLSIIYGQEILLKKFFYLNLGTKTIYQNHR